MSERSYRNWVCSCVGPGAFNRRWSLFLNFEYCIPAPDSVPLHCHRAVFFPNSFPSPSSHETGTLMPIHSGKRVPGRAGRDQAYGMLCSTLGCLVFSPPTGVNGPGVQKSSSHTPKWDSDSRASGKGGKSITEHPILVFGKAELTANRGPDRL